MSAAHGNQAYAGFWRRVAAQLLDYVLLVLATLPVVYVTGGDAADALSGDRAWTDPVAILTQYVLPFVVTVVLWVRLGGTPGKLLMECEVVDARTGRRITSGQAVLRYFGYLLSTLPLLLGFLWVMWDPRKQGFHDKLAGTVVVIPDDAEKSLAQLMEEAA